MADLEWTVEGDAAGVRLDKYLAGAGRLGSRSRAAAALERGKVFLNGASAGLAEAGRRLAEGDLVRVWTDRPGSARKPATAGPPAGRLRIVHEDDVLVVLDKPPGLLAVPVDRRSDAPSMQGLVEAHLRAKRRRPFVVHRIDRDTSGLVVFAKDAGTQRQLKAQFERREPERVYLAVVYGHPHPPAGTWHDRLVWDDDAMIQKETHPRDPAGKDAISDYRVIERFRETAFIEVRLTTGKRNQIRIQARLRGHTLVGEQRYTFGPQVLRPIDFPRQALHAHRLEFQHPVTGQPIRFEAPLPEDLLGLLDRLRRDASATS